MTETVAEPHIEEAVRRLSTTDIPARIAEGDNYASVAESIRHLCRDLTLGARDVMKVHQRLSVLEDIATSRVFSLEMSEGDRSLLASVSVREDDVPARLVEAVQRHGAVAVRERDVQEAIRALKARGELEHRLLADDLRRMMAAV